MMKRNLIFVVFVVIGAVCLAACDEEAPDKIVFGQVTSLTGYLTDINKLTTGPAYKLWIEDVNRDGGLYIEKYGKKIPIELLQYDDQSDVEIMKTQLDRLILEDKVDFLLPPVSTGMLFEAAPIANRYGYIMIGGAGGAIKLKEIISGLPYFFNALNFGDTQMPVLAEIMAEVGVERVAIMMIDDLHGVEYTATLTPLLAQLGIDVVMIKTYLESATEEEMGNAIVAAMMEADALEADAFLGFTYPAGSFTAAGAAMAIGYSPKLFHLNVGSSFASFRDAFGAAAVEGIMGPGAWNAKSSPGAGEFEQRFMQRWGGGDDPISVDYWGHLVYYASCQALQQAIEKAGSLDHNKIREILSTETFDTLMGPVKFEKGMMVGHVGQMGQWQNGVFEVIDPASDNRTAAPIYPKPAWPAGPPSTDTEPMGDAGVGGPDAGI